MAARSAISLYTGVGGLDFGIEAAGFATRVAIEWDPVACRTLRLNRSWPVLEGDIHDLSSESILRTAGLAIGEADLLIGGPPCQPFSKSSYWVSGDSGRLADSRSDTLSEYLRVLRDTKPRAFLLENVPGLAYRGKDEGLRLFLAGVAEVNRQAGTNYKISQKVVNAASLGVPQLRERVFLIGSRDGAEFTFPAATHGEVDSDDFLKRSLQPYATAWDALGDLNEAGFDESLAARGQWSDLLKSIPEGANYLWHTDRGGGLPLFGWRTRYWSFLLKLSKSLPSWTIQAKPGPAIGPFHWKNRRLSANELCRLQTFPDGIRFDCNQRDVQRLVGNAVPSLVAEVLGKAVRKQLFGDRLRTNRLTLLPPVREPTPAAEPVRAVEAKYRALAGDHLPHPGEGKGRGAAQRIGAITQRESVTNQRSLFSNVD
jgi:DNA (cytosine-5)-methyltransferase 1